MAELGWSIYAGEDKSMPVAQRFGGGGRFCSAFAVTPPPRVHFVGVWDTVSSFGGFANPRSLLYTADNPSIDHVRHALAIDEHRAAFRANLFRPSSVHQHQSIKQVWFAGVHSDVGGGYPEKRGTLSKVSLEWMLRESAAHGLIIDPVRAAELINSADHPPPAPLGEAHESLEGLWWAAEFLPHRSWDGERQKVVLKSPNFGRRRRIFTPKARDEPTEPPPVLHKSVVDRLASTREPKYRPTNLPGNYVVES
jgi:uncharacterized protein (DUF2235 family)